MKFKHIAALCKRNKYAVLYNGDERVEGQWISDGVSIMRVSGLPVLDEDSLKMLLDVNGKKKDSWVIERREPMNGMIAAMNGSYSDPFVKPYTFTIARDNKILRPVETSAGVVFPHEHNLSLLRTEFEDKLTLHEYLYKADSPFIIAKAGFFIEAILFPYELQSDNEYAREMDEVARGITEWRSRRTGFAVMHEQQVMSVVREWSRDPPP